MPNYLTHLAVHDDCRRLVLHGAAIDPALRQSVEAHARAGQMGAFTCRGDQFVVDTLEAARDAWPSAEAERLVAFCFGWQCHLAADRQLETLLWLLEPDPYLTPEADGPTTVSIYHDLFLLREVLADDATALFPPDVLAENHPSQAVEALFVGQWQQALLGLHQQTRQSGGDVGPWVDRFLEHRQTFGLDVARYVEAFNRTDNAYLDRVVEEHRFYDRTDPLLQHARAIQRGGLDPAIELDDAVEAAATQSHYARALRRAYLQAQAVSEFWSGAISAEELRLQVEQPSVHPDVREAATDPARREALLRAWHRQSGR
ncbi:MAG: hypothetical protein AAGI71_07575 [Bacteroidota bacterium]